MLGRWYDPTEECSRAAARSVLSPALGGVRLPVFAVLLGGMLSHLALSPSGSELVCPDFTKWRAPHLLHGAPQLHHFT